MINEFTPVFESDLLHGTVTVVFHQGNALVDLFKCYLFELIGHARNVPVGSVVIRETDEVQASTQGAGTNDFTQIKMDILQRGNGTGTSGRLR